VSGGLPQTGRVMVKDEDVCVHCGLCAERCPTAAWDMARVELILPKAGDRVNAAGPGPAKSAAGAAATAPTVPASSS
jgi:ferredoxin